MRGLAIVPLLFLPGACRDARPRALDPRFALVEAFPGHERYLRPLWFGPSAPGSLDHFVVEQGGLVWTFGIDERGVAEAPREFLDLSASVTTRGNEEGLLGLAFHPRFAENGRFFVYYSAVERAITRLAEFGLASRAPLAADPDSERVLLEIAQPYSNHKGGALAFGPDGKLYVAVGDGGSQGDPHEHAQDLGSLLGKILRVDVDALAPGGSVAVPADNPYVGPAGPAGARGEIWALGLRNPWRIAFDADGTLWCGDVGQDRFEEVDRVVRGGNYGWPRKEGFESYRERGARGPGALLDPVLVYSHSDGESITGGLVYRGTRLPELAGRYVFADYISHRVWSIAADPDAPGAKQELAVAPSVASFGTDAWGELHVCCYDGRIRKLVPAPAVH